MRYDQRKAIRVMVCIVLGLAFSGAAALGQSERENRVYDFFNKSETTEPKPVESDRTEARRPAGWGDSVAGVFSMIVIFALFARTAGRWRESARFKLLCVFLFLLGAYLLLNVLQARFIGPAYALLLMKLAGAGACLSLVSALHLMIVQPAPPRFFLKHKRWLTPLLYLSVIGVCGLFLTDHLIAAAMYARVGSGWVPGALSSVYYAFFPICLAAGATGAAFKFARARGPARDGAALMGLAFLTPGLGVLAAWLFTRTRIDHSGVLAISLCVCAALVWLTVRLDRLYDARLLVTMLFGSPRVRRGRPLLEAANDLARSAGTRDRIVGRLSALLNCDAALHEGGKVTAARADGSGVRDASLSPSGLARLPDCHLIAPGEADPDQARLREAGVEAIVALPISGDERCLIMLGPGAEGFPRPMVEAVDLCALWDAVRLCLVQIRIEEIVEETDAERALLEEDIGRHTETLNELQAVERELAKKKERLRDLKNENAELARRVDEARRLRHDADAKSEEELETREKRIRTMKGEIKNKETVIKHIKKTKEEIVSRKDAEIESLRLELSQSRKRDDERRRRHEKKIREKEREMESFVDEAMKTRADRNEKDRLLSVRDSEIEDLKKEVDRLRKSEKDVRNRLEKKIAVKEARIDALSEEAKKAAAASKQSPEIDAVRAEASRMRKSVEDIRSRSRAEMEKKKKRIEELAGEAERAQAEWEKEEKARKVAEKKNSEMKKKLKRKVVSINSLINEKVRWEEARRLEKIPDEPSGDITFAAAAADGKTFRLLCVGTRKLDAAPEKDVEISFATTMTGAIRMMGKREYDAMMVRGEVLEKMKAAPPKVENIAIVIVITDVGETMTLSGEIFPGSLIRIVPPSDRADWSIVRAILLEEAEVEAATLFRAGRERMIGVDPRVVKSATNLRNDARKTSNILVTGETGAGKELMARLVHAGRPDHDTAPYVVFNCTIAPNDIFESDLFGHEKGAFTGATERKDGRIGKADGGVLVLDEVGELDLGQQTKILRCMEENKHYRVGGTEEVPHDVQTVGLTNKDVTDPLLFKMDLLYRYGMWTDLPPLRERTPRDVRLLCRFFLGARNVAHGKNCRLSRAAMKRLLAYSFPGNIRELWHLINKAVKNAGPDGLIADIPLPETDGVAALTLEERTRWFQTHEIMRELGRAGGNLFEVAETLGYEYNSLWKKCGVLGITVSRQTRKKKGKAEKGKKKIKARKSKGDPPPS